MTAYEIAEQWQKDYTTTPLQERIDWHTKNGLIFITPQLFVIAFETYFDKEQEDIDMETTSPNAWFIELAASSDRTMPIRNIMQVLTKKNDWVLWCRRGINSLHSYNWDKLARKVGL